MPFDYFSILTLAAPQWILVLTALAVLGVDLLILREAALEQRFLMSGIIACAGCIGAFVWTFQQAGDLRFLDGMLVSDPAGRLSQLGVLVLTVCTILLTLDAKFTPHVGEYMALILLATVGMLFMVGSEELLTLFVALELTSLSLYILTAFNKDNVQSAEAALKYFLFGGVSAAFTLFGLSLVYGLAGSTYLRPIAEGLRGHPVSPLLLAAIVMTLIGFGFKVAAAPFHLWAPDAYQGAPTPSAALIASGSKVASFLFFARVLMVGFAGAEGSGAWGRVAAGWIPALGAVAAFSMVVGNLAAIVQRSVKRLLAYSAIAHAGYALLAVAANSTQGVGSLVYYVTTYGLTVVGAFGVVHLVEQRQGGSALDDFAGLGRRAPWVSFCMLIFLLSLAGIPPLAGFFGKFYVFAAALNSGQGLGLLWLVVLALAMSAVSLYYYLQVLKQIYVVEVPEDAPARPLSAGSLAAVTILAIAVVVLGCFPDLLLNRL